MQTLVRGNIRRKHKASEREQDVLGVTLEAPFSELHWSRGQWYEDKAAIGEAQEIICSNQSHPWEDRAIERQMMGDL